MCSRNSARHRIDLRCHLCSFRLKSALAPSLIAARPGDSRPGSVGGGRRPSPKATRSALDGFRLTPDIGSGDESPWVNREAAPS